jgi:hypothetical protein
MGKLYNVFRTTNTCPLTFPFGQAHNLRPNISKTAF